MRTPFLFSVAAAVALAATACGGTTSPSIDDAPAGDSDDALVTRKVKIAAIRFTLPDPATPGHVAHGTHDVTLAAPRKLTSVLKALKKRTKNDPTPQCSFSPATQMTFFGADGKVVGTGSYFCHQGTIDLDGHASVAITPDEGAIGDAIDAAPVPADALWAIDQVNVNRSSVVGHEGLWGPKIEKGKGDVAALVAAIGGEQALDASTTDLGCMAIYTLTFLRAGDPVATVRFGCGSGGPTNPHALGLFDAPGLAKGGIHVDGQAVTNVYLGD